MHAAENASSPGNRPQLNTRNILRNNQHVPCGLFPRIAFSGAGLHSRYKHALSTLELPMDDDLHVSLMEDQAQLCGIHFRSDLSEPRNTMEKRIHRALK